MDPAEALQAFVSQRAKLIEEIETSRVEVEAWLARYGTDSGVSLSDLALLAGIIELRRDVLVKLAKLDDEFLQNIRGFAS